MLLSQEAKGGFFVAKEISPPPPKPNVCTKEVFARCENNAICAFCKDCSLYKNSAEIRQEKLYNKQENKKKRGTEAFKTTYEKEGMNLEKRVAKQWNDAFQSKEKKKRPINFKPRFELEESSPTKAKESQEADYVLPLSPKRNIKPYSSSLYGENKTDEAKRQINSGALWFAKGDIKLEHALMEVKERGTKNARGEKTISIPKEWLLKQEKEAQEEGKFFWYLPFAYKGDDQIYLIKPYAHEIQLVQDVRLLEEENNRLRKELEERKNDTNAPR